jgi:hypothetical protein
MRALLASLFILGFVSFVQAEVKPIGTIVPTMCGENELESNIDGGRWVSGVCVAYAVGDRGKDPLRFIRITYSNGEREYLYIYKYKNIGYCGNDPNRYEHIDLLRIGSDLQSPRYITALTSSAFVTYKRSHDSRYINRNPLMMEGKTPTREPFRVTSFHPIIITM